MPQSHGSKNHGPTMPSTITSYPPRAYRFAASKNASMTIKFCSFSIHLYFTSTNFDCAKAEEGLKTTPNSECALNALAIDNPVEYARLYLDGTMQMWIDAEDSLELW